MRACSRSVIECEAVVATAGIGTLTHFVMKPEEGVIKRPLHHQGDHDGMTDVQQAFHSCRRRCTWNGAFKCTTKGAGNKRRFIEHGYASSQIGR